MVGRAGLILAAVTLGGSQVVFNLILRNPGHFPGNPGFHVWVVIWTQAVPVLILGGIDVLATRGGDRASRIWRSALYALTAFFFARQAQVHYPDAFYGLFPSWAGLPACLAAAAALAALSWKRPRETDRLFALLGILAVALTGLYLGGTLGRTSNAPPLDAAGPLEPAAPGRPVVLLLFDELGLDVLVKDGRIDAQAFPRLAALAEEGAWFPRATSDAALTEESIPTFLTGRRHPAADARTVFQRLRESHRLRAQVPWTFLHAELQRSLGAGDRARCRVDPEALRLGPLDTLSFLGTGLAESPILRAGFSPPRGEKLPLPDLWDLWESRDILAYEVESFLRMLNEEARPGRILYWHCSTPHFPFQYDREGRRHGRPDDRFSPGATNADAVWENYREQVRGVDRLVGLIVDRLKAAGVYDDTLLIVTSDHGLRTGGVREPEGYPEVQSGRSVRIPFIARGPSIRPGLRETDYQHVDFAPTLLELLGRPAEAGAFEGASAFGDDRPSREKSFFRGKKEYVLDPATGLWRLRKAR
jgi:hypothetical protein